MTSGDNFLKFMAGAQAALSIPIKPFPSPPVFSELPTAVERRRAKDIWKAAHRLQLLVKLWTTFLSFGLLRLRLDAATEAAVTEQFPELQGLGEVLNLFAEQAQGMPELAEDLATIDRQLIILRGPTPAHRSVDPRTANRNVQPLLNMFTTMIITEAQCLHRLDVNNDCFRRPWNAIRADVAALTSISGDWSESVIVLDFGGVLQRPSFQLACSNWTRNLGDLINLLTRYPAAALAASTPSNTNGNSARRPGRGLSRGEADRQTKEFLKDHPYISSKTIADRIGCSESLIRGTPAWKQRKIRPQNKSARPPGRKQVSLDAAIEHSTVRQFEDSKRTNDEDEECNEIDNGQLPHDEQLRLQIADQAKDSRQDARKRSRRP